MARPIRSQYVSAAVLAALVGAARSYAEDLASGLDDGTYDDEADLTAVEAALEIVDPEPRTARERMEAKAAGYHVSKAGHIWIAFLPNSSRNIGTADTQREAYDMAVRHMLKRKPKEA